MNIYTGRKRPIINYRKIYEQHHGEIPVDETGRTFDVHHIDGNPQNNDPLNLRAVSIQEHYDIHYAQGDYAACVVLGVRLNMPVSEMSRLSKLDNERRLKDGSHHFLNSEYQSTVNKQRVENGTHNFLGGDVTRSTNTKRISEGSHQFLKREDGSSISSDRVKDGSHHFLGGKIASEQGKLRMKNGTSNMIGLNNFTWTCPHCNKSGKGKGNYSKHHGDACKLLVKQ
jgi:hypothetical protein